MEDNVLREVFVFGNFLLVAFTTFYRQTVLFVRARWEFPPDRLSLKQCAWVLPQTDDLFPWH